MSYELPTIPASAGALIFDEQGRLLILDPTYKKGWTIPGGVMEADGESPWDACRREVAEETGLAVSSGRLVVVDTRPAKADRQLGLRFLFHCGTVSAAETEAIRLQESEARRHRFAPVEEALELLSKPVGRRVAAALQVPAGGCVYLENGRPVDGVN